MNDENPVQTIEKTSNIAVNKNTENSVFLNLFCNPPKEISEKKIDESKSGCECCNVEAINVSNVFDRIASSRYFKISFYKNNLAYFVFIFTYLLIQVALTLIQLKLYETSNIAIKVARVSGILISFNMGFVLLLVLRVFVTWLRGTRIGKKCLPFDDFLDFHKAIGAFILLLSLIHTGGHCVNLFWLSREYNEPHVERPKNSSYQSIYPSYVELLFTTKSKLGWFYQSAMPTGWIILIIMIIMEFFSISFFRKKGHFQLFYYTHWLHLIIYMVTILHATNYWKWFITPAVFVLIDRSLRCIRIKSSDYGVTFIKDVNLLPSKVTQLIIPRPQNFKFKSGDYVFVNIPEIASYEWHPFTISSAPELKEELWLHIRSLGNWTNKLHEYFCEYAKFNRQSLIYRTQRKLSNFFRSSKKETNLPNIVTLNYSEMTNANEPIKEENPELEGELEKQKVETETKTVSAKMKLNLIVSNQIKGVWCDIRIDGPYGTSSRRIFHAEHAVLIAGGIGVTPFASILQSLWFKYSKSLKKCPNCCNEWYDSFEEKKLKKVDFIWVNRDLKAFEWFIDLLAQIELQQSKSNRERFIDIRLFMTSVDNSKEIKFNAIQAFSDTNNSNINRELLQIKLQELLNRIQPGRPDLERIFQDISMAKKGKVEVFFCGANQFGKCVQKKCEKYNYRFSHEYF